MKPSKLLIIPIVLAVGFCTTNLLGQKNVRTSVVAFYNLENLYDTINDLSINDEEFLPNSAKNWNTKRYQTKLENLSGVIAKLGHDEDVTGPAVIGVSEVENLAVLKDLTTQPALKPFDYQIVHFDSPDKRGIDVALLYQPKYFKVTNARAFPLMIYDEETKERIYTRDMLVVSGLFDGEPMHFIVNHWPSRRGGKDNSYLRITAAQRCRHLVDSISQTAQNAKVIVMGDLNDDPTDASVIKYMNATGNIKSVKSGKMYNSMEPLFKNGIGTLAYRGQWNLFDQFLLTEPLVSKRTKGYKLQKARVFNEAFLIRDEGQYKGYPLRTFGGNDYLGGYSDHLPVYVVLVKEE
ncbi:MAG: endonuclease/exonuclease/phosphatase family protein [Breznakibacter sp.]